MSTTSTIEIDLIEKTVEKRKKIVEEAKNKAKTILKNAEAECARINANSDKQITQLMSSELKTVRERIIGQTELEGRKELMAARTKLLSQLYNLVENKLKPIVDEKDKEYDYHSILNNLIIESIDAIEGDEFIVSANKNDFEYLKKNLKKIEKTIEGKSLKLDVEPVKILGGVIVRNSAGNKIYYNTLDGRLEKVKKTMDAKIASMLGVI